MKCESEEKRIAANTGGFILECMRRKTAKPKSITWTALVAWLMIAAIVLVTIFLAGCANEAWAVTTECSFYTVASTIREGTGSGIGLTASGELLHDYGEYTAAHPTATFGTRLLITNKFNGRQIVARVNDRGPSAYLRRLGRSLDINLSAAKALGIVESGHALVEVTRVGE